MSLSNLKGQFPRWYEKKSLINISPPGDVNQLGKITVGKKPLLYDLQYWGWSDVHNILLTTKLSPRIIKFFGE